MRQGTEPPSVLAAQTHTHSMQKRKEGVCLCPGQIAQPCPESQRSRREETSESHLTFGDHRLPPRARLRACTQSQGTTTGVWPCPLLWGQRPRWLPPPPVWHFLLAEPCLLLPSLPLSDQSDETTRTATAIVPSTSGGSPVRFSEMLWTSVQDVSLSAGKHRSHHVPIRLLLPSQPSTGASHTH